MTANELKIRIQLFHVIAALVSADCGYLRLTCNRCAEANIKETN